MEQKDQPTLPGRPQLSSDLKGPSKSADSEKRPCSDGHAFNNGTTCDKCKRPEKVKTRPIFSKFSSGPVAGMPCPEGCKRVGEHCVRADIVFED